VYLGIDFVNNLLILACNNALFNFSSAAFGNLLWLDKLLEIEILTFVTNVIQISTSKQYFIFFLLYYPSITPILFRR